jgi:hypothetical protein
MFRLLYSHLQGFTIVRTAYIKTSFSLLSKVFHVSTAWYAQTLFFIRTKIQNKVFSNCQKEGISHVFWIH